MIDLPKEFNLISKFITGSNLYGTETESSDIDIRGIFIPSSEYTLGFVKNVEQYEDQDEEMMKFISLLKSL